MSAVQPPAFESLPSTIVALPKLEKLDLRWVNSLPELEWFQSARLRLTGQLLCSGTFLCLLAKPGFARSTTFQFTELMNPHHRRYIIAAAMPLLVTAAGGGVRFAVRDRASANQSQKDTNAVKSPDTSKWKLYRNEKYGFQLKYPETWAVRSSKGTPPEMIYFAGPYRSVVSPALTVAIQLNMNPRKLSIEEWFAGQLRGMDTQKLEAKGCSTVGGQPACFFEHTGKSGKERSAYTLLHQTVVLSFYYKLGTEDSPNCVAVIDSFRILN